MTRSQELVGKLEDTQAVDLANIVHNRVFSSLDYEVLEKSASGSEVGRTLLAVPEEQLDAKLDFATSVNFAREFLELLAKDPEMYPLIEDAWAEYQENDDQFVGAAIAVGLMVNLTLFMVSSEFEFNLGKFKLRKGKVETEKLKAVLEPVAKLVGLVSPD